MEEAIRQSGAIAKFLAEKGANVSHKDDKDRTPLDLAPNNAIKTELEAFRIIE